MLYIVASFFVGYFASIIINDDLLDSIEEEKEKATRSTIGKRNV